MTIIKCNFTLKNDPECNISNIDFSGNSLNLTKARGNFLVNSLENSTLSVFCTALKAAVLKCECRWDSHTQKKTVDGYLKIQWNLPNDQILWLKYADPNIGTQKLGQQEPFRKIFGIYNPNLMKFFQKPNIRIQICTFKYWYIGDPFEKIGYNPNTGRSSSSLSLLSPCVNNLIVFLNCSEFVRLQ